MEEEEEVSSQTQEKRASHLKCQSILIVGFLIWQPQNVMNISSCPPCVTRCRCLPALSGPPRVWAWHLTSEGPGRPGQCRSHSGVTSHLSDTDKGGVTSGVWCPVSSECVVKYHCVTREYQNKEKSVFRIPQCSKLISRSRPLASPLILSIYVYKTANNWNIILFFNYGITSWKFIHTLQRK